MYKNKKLIILNIIFTWNNILYTITNLRGDVLFWSSVGSHKVSCTKKITTTSIFLSIQDLKTFLHMNCISHVFLKIKGFSKHKKTVLMHFKQFYSAIILIHENINLPHNGCKKSKIKRL
uniref:ribosomal protein S11 n=1 Tax=Hypnea brasiliensis TaxID=1866962 RepID=UPI002411566D|nr:ribosomal protein S11 [Hypnea brasiliensis]WCH58026.1 ribosomal protein S11 [Hypnea brasiliensis]WDY85166.1 ribosomal protein S11 [Hypnea brasiliensis]